jgi:Protein kinase domain
MLPPLRAQSGSVQELLARSREGSEHQRASPPPLRTRPRVSSNRLIDDIAAVLRRGRNSPDSLPQAILRGESPFGGNAPRRNVSADQVLDLRTQPSQQSFADVYRVGALLGVGSFATVHEATHRLTGESFVVKAIKARDEGVQEEEIRRQTVAKEITACARLAHPNI